MIVSFAQPESARIQGTVTDSTRVVIAGATVKVASTATGREVTASSGDDRSFSVLSLPPGRYGVEVTAANCKTTKQEITLEATQTAPLTVALEAGAVSETVTVTHWHTMEAGDTTESGAPALFEKRPIFWQFAERRPEFHGFTPG